MNATNFYNHALDATNVNNHTMDATNLNDHTLNAELYNPTMNATNMKYVSALQGLHQPSGPECLAHLYIQANTILFYACFHLQVPCLDPDTSKNDIEHLAFKQMKKQVVCKVKLGRIGRPLQQVFEVGCQNNLKMGSPIQQALLNRSSEQSCRSQMSLIYHNLIIDPMQHVTPKHIQH